MSIDADRLGRALEQVDEEDALLGVVDRGRKVDRIVATYDALGDDELASYTAGWSSGRHAPELPDDDLVDKIEREFR